MTPLLPADYATPPTIEEIRAAWLAAALDEWATTVRDDQAGKPGDRAVITGYFAACRWDWHVPGGYVERSDNPWCGIFAGAMGLRIGRYVPGVTLDPDLAYHVLPSTQRLARPAKWRAAGHTPSRVWQPGPSGWVDLAAGRGATHAEVMLPGVVACIAARRYGDVRDEVGGHVVIVERIEGDTVYTVEGNAVGELGDGTRGEGVVRCARPVSVFRRVYHFGDPHFERMER